MDDNFKRRPNELSLSRVKTIMKSSPDVENVSQDSVYLVTKATELFIRYMVQEAYKESDNSKSLDYKHVSELVQTKEKLAFLREIVPRKCRLRDIEHYRRQRGLKPRTPGMSSSSSEVSLSSDDEIMSAIHLADTSTQKSGKRYASSSGPSEKSGNSRTSLSRTKQSSGLDRSTGNATQLSYTSSHFNTPPGTPTTITLSSSSREASLSPTFMDSGLPERDTASSASVASVSSPSPSPSYSSLSPEVLSAVGLLTQGSVDIVDIPSDSDSSACEMIHD